MTKILVVGDNHGDSRRWQQVAHTASESDCEVILQVGDFGYWPRWDSGELYVDLVSGLAQRYDIPVYFIDGNHEDFDVLFTTVGDNYNSFHAVGVGVWYAPRGHTWTWDGFNFMSMGGAHSTDHHLRTHGVDWFPEEDIRYSDVERGLSVIEEKNIDFLVTHEAPSETFEKIYDGKESSGYNCKVVSELVWSAQPMTLFCGHHHKRVDHQVGNTNVVVLGHNLDKLDNQIFILDTENLTDSSGGSVM